MGNQVIDIQKMGWVVEIMPEFCSFGFETITDSELERLTKLGGFLGLQKHSEKTERIQSGKKPFTPLPQTFKKGQSGNPAGKPKGTRNFSTLALEVLRKMKTKDGKQLREEDFVRLGFVPLFEGMTGKQSARYHKLYMDMVGMIYGKAKETVDHQNDGGKFEPPIITGVRIVKEE